MCPVVCEKQFILYYINGGTQKILIVVCQWGYTGMMLKNYKRQNEITKTEKRTKKIANKKSYKYTSLSLGVQWEADQKQ